MRALSISFPFAGTNLSYFKSTGSGRVDKDRACGVVNWGKEKDATVLLAHSLCRPSGIFLISSGSRVAVSHFTDDAYRKQRVVQARRMPKLALKCRAQILKTGFCLRSSPRSSVVIVSVHIPLQVFTSKR